MSTCILTFIKNEHLYLDEWIKYHLDIGVNHIFIFEDIDSQTHKDITNQYQQVTLNNVSFLLTPEELIQVKQIKQTKQGNAQAIYYKKGLQYLKDLKQFDWCFLIDNDEFITLTDNLTALSQLLDLYNNYDAVLLSWLCYGANGLVNQPDYSKTGVLDTFTTTITGNIPLSSPTYNKKICYNLNTYCENFWRTIHTPEENCNYCNTIFKKDNASIYYDHIFLRHYITKSWEEYLWKIQTRGYFVGKTRSLYNFFNINQDMKQLAWRLLRNVPRDTLVILPYSQDGSQGNEIELALQAWRHFCQFSYHFVVIGNFNEQLPKTFPWVEFINMPKREKLEGQYNPHIDMQYKMEWAKQHFDKKYSGFIWMVDDNYAIKPFSLGDILTLHYKEKTFMGDQTTPTWYWRHDKWKTRQLLDVEGLPHINYTTHFPCYFEFDKLEEIWNKYDLRHNSYVVEDLYFNTYAQYQPVSAHDVRLGIWDKKNTKQKIQYASIDPAIKFLCNSTDGWNKELGEEIQRLIDEKGVQ